MKTYQVHKLSHYFPMLPPGEFEQLKQSIAQFGLLEPITLLDGKILDGRNRYQACLELGIEPSFREYTPNEHAPLDFVVAVNMRRRHLTDAQKAQIIIDVEGMPTTTRGGDHKSNDRGRLKSAHDLAKQAGVSDVSVRRVAEVQDRPELKAKLRAGEITAREAVRERMNEVADKAKIEPTWKGLYAKWPRAKEIATDLGRIINGVERWLGNEDSLSKIDPAGHTPLLLKKIDQAIAALQRLRTAIEELRNG